ncbi:hypothetical protein RND81_01G043400 [Saponaria officinalis]|uniref:RING-type domain-containing protein n=2 Tax=Saponaria officinalis TaxID=3572 RepID=A0AAW1N5M1_SAPOF
MGFDNDCILNIQSLAGEYFCAVCRTLVYPNEAIQAPCTHLYCKPCLTYVVSTTHACPYDGYRVTEADSKPLLESNKTLADTIGKIQVHCLYYRTGCTWQGSLSDSTAHGPTCTFGESAVLCNKCGIQLKHRQVQEHAQNCSGVQSQVQQSGGVQDSTSIGATSAPDQTQTAVQAGGSSSQAQTSQASTLLVASQNANQTANPAVPPQAAQAATLTPEQLYQQQQYQQQYQQYYQQYPGYDPYQQNYQYYYQYPQAAQQYQQPQTQAYPQAYGQPQAQAQTQTQGYGQAQTQPIVQAQQQVQPQVPSQGAQPPLQSQGQPAVNAQPQVASVGQAQPQMQGPSQAPPSHAPYNQAQPYNQSQAAPPQQLQGPQYPQTHSQMQHPHAQPYPQSQAQQHYTHPQPQLQSQPHSQAAVHPPQQPFPQSAQLPTTNPVMGYQSYPQPPQIHPQAQAGAGQPVHVAGAQYPSQMQGQFPSQTAQNRPPQPYTNVPNQQQPETLSAQGQPPSGPSAQQLPVYPHAQQSGYPIQQRPTVQAAPQQYGQQYGQQQSFPGQGPYMQHQPAQLNAQGPPQMPPQPQQNYVQPHSVRPNVAHNYTGRPMGVQTVAHPYAQTAGLGGAAQVRPPQPNQNHPMNTNSQMSSAEQHATQSQQVLSGEKPRDPTLEKGLHNQNDSSNEARDMATGYSAGQKGDEMKSKASNGLAVNADGNNSKSYLSGSKLTPSSDTMVDNHVQEAKLRTNGDAGEGLSDAPSGKNDAEDPVAVNKKNEVQNLKNMAKNGSGGSAPLSSSPNSHSKSQVHDGNSFPSIDHGRNQQSAFPGHPSNQLRPQGPGQAHSNAFPPENPSGGMHGPGSSGSMGRPSNVNYYQGNLPPHQAGQPQNPHANPQVGPSFDGHQHDASRSEIEKFAAHRSGHFDGRQPDSHPHGPREQTSFGPGPHGIQPGAMKFGGPSTHDSMPAPGLRDGRGMPFVEEQIDFRKFPRPPNMQAGSSSNYGSQFPSSGPLDHGSRTLGGDGMLRSFDKEPHGIGRDPAFRMNGVGSGALRPLPPFHPKDVGERPRAFPDDDMRRADFGRVDLSRPLSGPDFGRTRMDGLHPRSPRKDYPDFPSRMSGPYGHVGRNDPRSFENSKPFAVSPEAFGNPLQKSRFPVPSRGDLDLRVGEHFGPNQDLMPSHLQRGGRTGLRGLPLGDASGFGRPGDFSWMEPPLSGNFPPHIRFGDSFGGEKTGLPLVGEPGFRSGYGFPHYARDDGFDPREIEHFDNLRKRKPGSIMCRICKVECGSVDGLELHSQSREHQQKARDMVLSIKQQNKKKQKVSNDQAFVEEGRNRGKPRHSGFQGRGHKR